MLAWATTVGALAMVTVPATAAPTHADREWIACQGRGPGSASPGFTFAPRDIKGTVEIKLAPCVSSIPTIHAGDLHVRFKGDDVTCLEPSVHGKAVINWDDGSVSRMVWSTDGMVNVGVVRGQITGGSAFVGNEVVIPTLLLTDDPPRCDTSEGITSFRFEELDFLI